MGHAARGSGNSWEGLRVQRWWWKWRRWLGSCAEQDTGEQERAWAGKDGHPVEGGHGPDGQGEPGLMIEIPSSGEPGLTIMMDTSGWGLGLPSSLNGQGMLFL